jgi:hypothetical protein
MSDEREGYKKPTWPWIAMSLPLLYVVTLGPLSWLVSWQILPPNPTANLYLPIFWAADRGPQWFETALAKYAGFGEFRLGSGYGRMYIYSGARELRPRDNNPEWRPGRPELWSR